MENEKSPSAGELWRRVYAAQIVGGCSAEYAASTADKAAENYPAEQPTESQQPSNLVEVVRSFTYKHNAGNYESNDFFCSQKCECKQEDAEATSERLYQFCKSQVMKSVQEFLAAKAKGGR